MPLVNAGDAGHDLPGRAVAALEGIALDKGGLQRMELLALRQALDGRDLATLDQSSERETRLHALAVDQHRARATLAETAALLRSRQMKMLAQDIEQRGTRIKHQAMLNSVHTQDDGERSRRRGTTLCHGRRCSPRHELSSHKSAAGHHGY